MKIEKLLRISDGKYRNLKKFKKLKLFIRKYRKFLENEKSFGKFQRI